MKQQLQPLVSARQRVSDSLPPPSPKNKEPAFAFPVKLYAMLEDSRCLGFEDVVGWQSDEKSFKVYDPSRFTQEILSRYFNQTKYKSFQRQLNIYGFKRVHSGPNKGGYSHHLFCRRDKDLCGHMVRQNVAPKVSKSSSSTNHASKSLFSATNTTRTSNDVANISSLSRDPGAEGAITKLDYSGLIRFFNDNSDNSAGKASLSLSSTSSTSSESEQVAADIKAAASRALLKEQTKRRARNQRGVVPHHDANTPSPLDTLLSVISTQHSTEENEEHSFPWKLHSLLEDAETQSFTHVVSWVSPTSFKVHNTSLFVSQVMPNYFDQTKYESFRRQLNLYGFSRVTRGSQKGIISHPHFVRQQRSLCKQITRKPGTGPATVSVQTLKEEMRMMRHSVDESSVSERSSGAVEQV